VIECGGLNKYK